MGCRCPVSLAPLLVNPVRRWLADPVRLLKAWVSSGDRVLDLGCGAGFHSEALARLVGPSGEVVLADVQQEMLDLAMPYCVRAGTEGRGRLTPLLVPEGRWPLEGSFNLVLLHWVLHEVGDQFGMWRAVAAHLGPAGRVLVAEPRAHVSGRVFDASLLLPLEAGLAVQRRWGTLLSRWVVLTHADVTS